MAVDVEAIWTALVDRLEDEVVSVKTVSRRPREWAVEEYPVIEVWDNGDESPTTLGEGLPPAWKLGGQIVILSRTLDTDAAPTAKLNELIKAVKEALERKPSDRDATGAAFYGYGHSHHYTTLGGLIRSLSITRVEKGQGADTGQGIAKLTIEMETAAV